MKTIKLKIKECSDVNFIAVKQKNYSYAFRKAYKNYDRIGNKQYIDSLKGVFYLNDIEVRSLLSEVKTRFKQTQTDKDDLEKKIVDVENEINVINDKINNYLLKDNLSLNKLKRRRFKLNNKLSLYNKRLSKDIVFGGYSLVKKISYLSNDKGRNRSKLNETIEEYRQERLRSFYIMGEANQEGNRFFKFDFQNKVIIYKPQKGIKIELKFGNYSSYKKELLLLQNLIEDKKIAITVYLSTNYISITFDDEKLYNYAIDEKERKKEILDKTKNITDKDTRTNIIKKIYQKYYKEQERLKLDSKLDYRYFSVDLNPDYIGCSILDKLDDDGEFKVVKAFYYNFTDINKKLPRLATAEERKRRNNQKKHDLYHVWKEIFKKISYYNCGYFILEDLNLKNTDLENKEGNRKVNNVWHREITNKLIEKYCTKKGIIKVEVNPIYSSFIGNLQYDYIDPINASIEIGRRGMIKYIKNNSFYPEIDMGTILNAMSRLNNGLRDVSRIKDRGSWNGLYRLIKTTRLRYRMMLDDCKRSYNIVNNMSHKNVNCIIIE